jgi:hypothetical protein
MAGPRSLARRLPPSIAGGAMRGADFIKLTQQAQRVHSALEKGAK